MKKLAYKQPPKALARLLAPALALCLLFGCLPGEGTAGGQGALPGYAPSAAPSGTGGRGGNAPAGNLRVLLPADAGELEGILATMAAQEGLTLYTEKLAAGTDYAKGAKQALESANPPDIVWLQGEGDAQTVGAGLLANLSAARNSPALQALAAMAPEGDRLLDAEKVYGLPVGYYAEGYLVNLDLLAALLAAENQQALLEDLGRATWLQWITLANGMEQYLKSPGRAQLKLANTTYVTPGYRPGKAQPLRGVFAFADGAGEEMLQGALSAAVGLFFSGPAGWLAAEEEEKTALLPTGLAALYGLLDFETMHMARREGVVWRSEDYAQRQPLTTAEAEELFVNGTALFLRANSRTGLRLEAENPVLSGRLALIPVKMPVPFSEEEAGGEAETDDEAEDEEATARAAWREEVQETITAKNQLLGYASGGYLCLGVKAAQNTAAQALLLRLFTTAQGQAALEGQLNLQVFSDPFPSSPLLRQVAAAAAGGGRQLAQAPYAMQRPQTAIAKFVLENLMDKEEWDEEAQGLAFMQACYNAYGLKIELDVPEITPESGANAAG